MKDTTQIEAVAGACIKTVDDVTYILISERRHNDRYKPSALELPGGKVDDGEELHEALIREFKEELDLDIEATPENILLTIHGPARGSRYKVHLFLVQCPLDQEPKALEVSKFFWVPLELVGDFRYNCTHGFPTMIHAVKLAILGG